jgi:hypothetical protein
MTLMVNKEKLIGDGTDILKQIIPIIHSRQTKPKNQML